MKFHLHQWKEPELLINDEVSLPSHRSSLCLLKHLDGFLQRSQGSHSGTDQHWIKSTECFCLSWGETSRTYSSGHGFLCPTSTNGSGSQAERLRQVSVCLLGFYESGERNWPEFTPDVTHLECPDVDISRGDLASRAPALPGLFFLKKTRLALLQNYFTNRTNFKS